MITSVNNQFFGNKTVAHSKLEIDINVESNKKEKPTYKKVQST